MYWVLRENGTEIDGGGSFRLLLNFADPMYDKDLFEDAMSELKETGSFEWVQDNKVYLIEWVTE